MSRIHIGIGLLAGSLACSALASAGAPASEDLAHKLRDPARLLVIAHRGCVGEAPEVSLASIHACAGGDIDGVEIDVRRSSDGVLVAIHDATLERTTDGQGRVAELTAAELRQFRLRRGNGGPNVVVTDEPLPTVEEMLVAAREHGFLVHMDIKDASHAEVAEVVRRTGMAGRATAWITGAPGAAHQPDASVGEVLAIVPRIQDCPTGSPAGCQPNDLGNLMGFAPYRPAGYFLWYRSTPEFVAAFKAAPRPPGTRLMTETLWVIDNLPTPERHAAYRRVIDAGASMILTDKPADMVAFLRNGMETHP